MILCPICNEQKSSDLFYKSRTTTRGVGSYCKSCDNAKRKLRSDANPEIARKRTREWAKANPDRKVAMDAAYYAANKEKAAALGSAYYIANKAAINAQHKAYAAANAEHLKRKAAEYRASRVDDVRARRRKHYAENKVAYVANARKREADKLRATPWWADLDKIETFYAERERVTTETGITHHVDHIVPLRGKNVCGLHVHYNLRVIPAAANLKKGACFIQEVHLCPEP